MVLPFLYKKNCIYCIKKNKNKYYREYENKKRNPMTSEKICFKRVRNFH